MENFHMGYCHPMPEEKIFECRYPGCGKIFNSCWSLTRHSRTHSDRKPFKCQAEGCDREFVEKCALRRHEQTHNDDKKWECPIPSCGKKFKLKEYLDVHRKTHTKGRFQDGTGSSNKYGIHNPNMASNLNDESLIIHQLQERLERNGQRYYEDVACLQADNDRLKSYLRECGFALEMAISLVQAYSQGQLVPTALTNVLSRISHVNEYLAQTDSDSGSISPSNNNQENTYDVMNGHRKRNQYQLEPIHPMVEEYNKRVKRDDYRSGSNQSSPRSYDSGDTEREETAPRKDGPLSSYDANQSRDGYGGDDSDDFSDEFYMNKADENGAKAEQLSAMETLASAASLLSTMLKDKHQPPSSKSI